jgi:hypothetical protein
MRSNSPVGLTSASTVRFSSTPSRNFDTRNTAPAPDNLQPSVVSAEFSNRSKKEMAQPEIKARRSNSPVRHATALYFTVSSTPPSRNCEARNTAPAPHKVGLMHDLQTSRDLA